MVNKFKLMLEGVPYEIERRGDLLLINGLEFPCAVENQNVTIGGTPHAVVLRAETAIVDGISYRYEALGLEEPKPGKAKRALSATAAEDAGAVTAIMPGLIIKINKKEGDLVAAGETILVLEAMKMQNEIQSKVQGRIKSIHVKPGESVEMRQVLAVVEPTA